MSTSNGQGPVRTLEGVRDSSRPEVEGYEVLERIGKGGMGEVYVARQITLKRLVALKFLVPEWDPDPENDSARFRREAELMANVCHPHVLSLFDFGEAGGRQYLVMEYVEGGDLRRRLTPGEPLSVGEVRSVIGPVAEALDYLHRQGIIHRDLKPENILLHEGTTPLVTDFGIAVLRAGNAGGSLTRTGRGVGTLGYVAPEQQYRLKVDERADQFSLAAMAYEMLTGHLPLGIFKAPSLLNTRLSAEVDAVIVRALQENPKDRYGSVREFAAALDLALNSRPSPPRSRGKWAWWVLCAVSALAATALAAVATGIVASPTLAPLGEEFRPAPRPPQLPDGNPPARVLPPKINPANGENPQAQPSHPPAPDPKPSDPLIEELKHLVADRIWKARGSPQGAAGDAVSVEIWYEAEHKVDKDLNRIAYEIWDRRGRLEGEAEKNRNWKEARERYYKSLTGHDYQENGGPESHKTSTPP